MLTITVKNLGETVVLQCVGRVVRGHEGVLLCSALRQNAKNIVLDLSRVDAIDAAGIGALVSLQAASVYLKLANPTRPVREVLRVTQLDTIFEICESAPTPASMESAAAGRIDDPCGRVLAPVA